MLTVSYIHSTFYLMCPHLLPSSPHPVFSPSPSLFYLSRRRRGRTNYTLYCSLGDRDFNCSCCSIKNTIHTRNYQLYPKPTHLYSCTIFCDNFAANKDVSVPVCCTAVHPVRSSSIRMLWLSRHYDIHWVDITHAVVHYLWHVSLTRSRQKQTTDLRTCTSRTTLFFHG